MLTFVVTPSIFASLPSRTQSGNVVGIILHRADVFRFFTILAILVTEFIKYSFGCPSITNKEILITCLNSTIFLFLIGYSFIDHRINSLRAQIVSFDDLAKDDPTRKLFHFWHGMMVSCLIISIFLGGSILVLRFVF